jgi:hypothetical protein
MSGVRRAGVPTGPAGTAQEETPGSARKHLTIKEIQSAVARELAAQSEIPKTMPQRIADLLRELHRRLRNTRQGAARSTEASTTGPQQPLQSHKSDGREDA